MPGPLNIILIDDHPLLRMGVAGYIQQEPDLTLTAQLANAAELRDWLAAGNRADAALLDRSLPEADGLDLVRNLPLAPLFQRLDPRSISDHLTQKKSH